MQEEGIINIQAIDRSRGGLTTKIHTLARAKRCEPKNFPPIVFIVTKYDMCMRDTDADEIKEIIQHEKVFGRLFKGNDTIIAVIPVSLGDTLMDDSYAGDLDPINIGLPILFGVNFAPLIDLIYRGKCFIEERQKRNEENQRELNWARNQKRIEDNRWGITRRFFGGYDPDLSEHNRIWQEIL